MLRKNAKQLLEKLLNISEKFKKMSSLIVKEYKLTKDTENTVQFVHKINEWWTYVYQNDFCNYFNEKWPKIVKMVVLTIFIIVRGSNNYYQMFTYLSLNYTYRLPRTTDNISIKITEFRTFLVCIFTLICIFFSNFQYCFSFACLRLLDTIIAFNSIRDNKPYDNNFEIYFNLILWN